MLCCELVYRIMFVHCTVLCVFTEQYSMMCVHCTAQYRLCLYSGQYYACTYTAQYYDCTMRSIMFVHCTVLAMRVHCTVLCVYTVPVQYYVFTLYRYSIGCVHCTGTVLCLYTVQYCVQCCGSKYIEFGSGSRMLVQFESGSRVMLKNLTVS